jgi:hypothetical protein
LHWLWYPSKINGDNLNNIMCEASRHFWNKKKGYLKNKTKEFATNSKNMNIEDMKTGINEY